MAEIFLSYRRQDSQSATGRLADDLEAHFGSERVFRDREIAAGEDFIEAIRRSVESSTVVLAIVGPRWLDARDAEGRRRLEDPADFVRLEIELALAGGVAVVPLLVEGATMPAETELPPSLAAFSRCQAVELSDRRWRADADALFATLQSRFAIDSDRVPLDSGTTGGIAALTRWGVDLIDLARHPQRLIARRQTGSARDLVRAFAFLCAAILLGNVMLLTAIDVRLVAQGSLARVVVGVATYVLTGMLVGLLAAGLLAITVALAWRVADRRAGYRHVGLVGAYVYGGAWLGFCVGAMLALASVDLVEPGGLGRMFDSMRSAAASGVPLQVPSLEHVERAPFRGAASVLFSLGIVVWIATAVWVVVAWGAFRQAFAATRWQAWLATSVWLAILAAIVWLPLQLA